MKNRTLLDGTEAPEYEFPVTLQVHTKCPSKYKLIDMETGEEYTPWETPGPYQWKKIKNPKG